MRTMKQTAPYPEILDELVQRLSYRPGWSFSLDDIERDPESTHGAQAGGLTFVVTTLGYNSYHHDLGQNYRVNHYFIVPAATYNEQSWKRWLFDCLLKVETHEAMEFFRFIPLSQGEHEDHPYAPNHGPGNDPYIVRELSTDAERRTSFRGQVKNG